MRNARNLGNEPVSTRTNEGKKVRDEVVFKILKKAKGRIDNVRAVQLANKEKKFQPPLAPGVWLGDLRRKHHFPAAVRGGFGEVEKLKALTDVEAEERIPRAHRLDEEGQGLPEMSSLKHREVATEAPMADADVRAHGDDELETDAPATVSSVDLAINTADAESMRQEVLTLKDTLRSLFEDHNVKAVEIVSASGSVLIHPGDDVKVKLHRMYIAEF